MNKQPPDDATPAGPEGDPPATTNVAPPAAELVGAEPVGPAPSPSRVAHLSTHRSLIVRRSLLATALGGIVPIPVLDDYVAGRVRAGLLIKIAEARQVDLPSMSAALLSDPKESSRLRNATLTAASLVAIKLAWRKMLAVLTLGRGAEEMATTFQSASLFDHYCARLHVGGALAPERAVALRRVIHQTIEHTSKTVLVNAFSEGARTLGRSLLEAPRWLSTRLGQLAERWVQTRGNPAATLDEVDVSGSADETRWLDKAAAEVDRKLSALGTGYLEQLVVRFEDAYRKAEEARVAAEKTAPPPAAGSPGAPPPAAG